MIAVVRTSSQRDAQRIEHGGQKDRPLNHGRRQATSINYRRLLSVNLFWSQFWLVNLAAEKVKKVKNSPSRGNEKPMNPASASNSLAQISGRLPNLYRNSDRAESELKNRIPLPFRFWWRRQPFRNIIH